jgi:hypothetical protein
MLSQVSIRISSSILSSRDDLRGPDAGEPTLYDGLIYAWDGCRFVVRVRVRVGVSWLAQQEPRRKRVSGDLVIAGASLPLGVGVDPGGLGVRECLQVRP